MLVMGHRSGGGLAKRRSSRMRRSDSQIVRRDEWALNLSNPSWAWAYADGCVYIMPINVPSFVWSFGCAMTYSGAQPTSHLMATGVSFLVIEGARAWNLRTSK
jgi:hypothetical protein